MDCHGREAAVAGETLILDIVLFDTGVGELRHRLPVCVIESRPIILDGDMRHRIRLHGGTVADWPGADVSSCQGQTSRREEADLAPTVRALSLQVTRFKAVRPHSRLGCSVGTVPAT